MYEIILTVVMSMLDIPGYRYDSERSFPIKRAVFANFFLILSTETSPRSEYSPRISPRLRWTIGNEFEKFRLHRQRSSARRLDCCRFVQHKVETGCVHPVNYEHGYETITVFDEKVAHTMQPHSI